MNITKYLKGFTLVELVVIVSVIGIVSVAAAPVINDAKKEAVIAEMGGLLSSLNSGLNKTSAKMQVENINLEANELFGIDCDEDFNSQYCLKYGDVNIRSKGGYPEKSEVYKISNANINVLSAYKSENACTSLSEEQRTCNSDYCFCGNANVSKEIKSRLNSKEITPDDVAVFWPNGYEFSGNADTKGCYIIYAQYIKNQHNKPKFVFVNDGC